MTGEQQIELPTERMFLEITQILADEASAIADDEASKAGNSAPASMDGLGRVLSLLYRFACCAYGCKGGDHQIEWLIGRIVNHATSAHRLMRAGFYDEALVLIRGIGEIANLLWLFAVDGTALIEWKASDRKMRLKKFGPAAVRKALKATDPKVPLVDDDRYQALCEIGTHPVPAVKPGHYSAGGPPVLGMYFQLGGYLMCLNELGFAVAMCAAPAGKLLDANTDLKKQARDEVVTLLNALGSITVLNYNEMIAAALPTS